MLDHKTLEHLYTLRRRGIKIGLHRTKTLLSKCGDPHNEIPVIHIAGTNGKGSTAAMIASILRELGRKVGLYTSPHLVRFNERIRINGIPIPDEAVASFIEKYKADIDRLGSTFFETTTALTFTHFSRGKVDIAVIEVGLGGRLDSTNVANSVLSVITPIDYDHMNFLGYNIRSITKEKCGILKPGVPVVVSYQHHNVMKYIHQLAEEMRSTLHYAPNKMPVKKMILSENVTSFESNGVKYSIPLLGEHQITNAQSAITACLIFDSTLDKNIIKKGLSSVGWFGRLQILSKNPTVYYDVAHNSHGIKAVLSTLYELHKGKQINCICALKKSKAVDSMVGTLKQYCRLIITTKPEHDGFYEPAVLSQHLNNYGITSNAAQTLTEALNICKQSQLKDGLWLIFGTHYLAEEVYEKFHFPFDNGNI